MSRRQHWTAAFASSSVPRKSIRSVALWSPQSICPVASTTRAIWKVEVEPAPPMPSSPLREVILSKLPIAVNVQRQLVASLSGDESALPAAQTSSEEPTVAGTDVPVYR